MSYWITMEIDAGGPGLVSLDILDENMTWNLRPMFAAVNNDKGPSDWHDLKGSEVAEILTRTIAAWDADPAKFEAMNPENGWGDFEDAQQVANTILAACNKAPNAVLRVS